MAHDILESGKFRQFLTEIQTENRKIGQKQIDEMIKITFNDLINRMNQDLARTEENIGKYQTLQQEYVEKIETENPDLKNDIQKVIQKFQPILESNPNQVEILELKGKLETAQNDMEALMILVKKLPTSLYIT